MTGKTKYDLDRGNHVVMNAVDACTMGGKGEVIKKGRVIH